MRTSVIIATYNAGRFVGDAIRSVQAQTVDDLEIIVIDDGSTDETQDVLAGIRDPRLRVHRISNSGVSVARNTGMAMADGEFIAFLDADDLWRPTKLERQLALMQSAPEVGLCYTNFIQFTREGFYPRSHFEVVPEMQAQPSRPSREGGGHVLTADAFASMVPNRQLPVWPPTLMLRAEQVREVRFPPGVRLCEDLHFVLRVLPRVGVGYIMDPLVEVRRHGNNSYSAQLEIQEAGLSVYQQVEREPLSPAHLRILRQRIGRGWNELAYFHFHSRNPRAAASAAFRALRYPGARARAIKRLALLPAMPLVADPRIVDWSVPANGQS